MDDLAVCWQALKNDIFTVSKLNHHMFSFPIDVPCLRININCWVIQMTLFVFLNLIVQFHNFPKTIYYLNCVKSPCFYMISILKRHSHDAIESHSQKLLTFFTVKSDNKKRNAIIGQGLPGLDEIHFCFQKIKVLHIYVGLQKLVSQLKTKNKYSMRILC